MGKYKNIYLEYLLQGEEIKCKMFGSQTINGSKDEYLMLTKAKYGWIADSIDPTNRTVGKTPEEAVAKLWLKLKKKK
jgi:hypothetical protein